MCEMGVWGGVRGGCGYGGEGGVGEKKKGKRREVKSRK